MAGKSLFGRDDDTNDPTEGVRLLGAEEAAEAAERSGAAKRRGEGDKRFGDRPEPPTADVTPAMRFPLSESQDAADLDRPAPRPAVPRHDNLDDEGEVVLSVEPPTGETQLPHWTEPATGEVPRVVISGDDDESAMEAAKWQAFAGGTPRWRDEGSGEIDDFSDLRDDDVLGALDTRDRPTTEELLSFDDLDVPSADAPRAPARGSAADPIRISAGRARPAGPPGERSGPTRSGTPSRGAAARAAARPRSGPGGGGEGPAGPRRSASSGGRDRQQAIQVGLGIAATAVVLMLLGGVAQWAMLLAVVPILVFAVAEFFTSTRRAGFKPAHLSGLVATFWLPLAAYFRGEQGIMLVIALFVAALIGLYLLGDGPGRPVANIAITITGVVYVGVLGSYAALLLRAGPFPGDPLGPAQGNWFLWLVAWGTVLHDVAGYLLGSRIGRTPLSAASPNKTREGLLVGMAAAFIGVVVWGGLVGIGVQSFGQAVVLGLVIAVTAPAGDLAESLFKRDLGVKDMGDALPSHGGVLDRFDAFLFTLPAAYYTLLVLGLVS